MMGWYVLAFLVFFLLVFLAGAQWGYRGGVTETERRWHDAAKRAEHYFGQQLSDAHERTRVAELALKARAATLRARP